MVERARDREIRINRVMNEFHKRNVDAHNKAWEKLGGKSTFGVNDHQIDQVLQSAINVRLAAKAVRPDSAYPHPSEMDKLRQALFFNASEDGLSSAFSWFLEQRDTARKELERGPLTAIAVGELRVKEKISRDVLRDLQFSGRKYLSSGAAITFLEAKGLSKKYSAFLREAFVSGVSL